MGFKVWHGNTDVYYCLIILNLEENLSMMIARINENLVPGLSVNFIQGLDLLCEIRSSSTVHSLL